MNYNAQQAAKEHRPEHETVVINIEILPTQSYPAAIPKPTGSRSGSPVGFQIRSSDFWKDFKVRVFDGEKQLPTDSLPGWLEYDARDSLVDHSIWSAAAWLPLFFLSTQPTSHESNSEQRNARPQSTLATRHKPFRINTYENARKTHL